MDSYSDTSDRIDRDWLDRHDEELEQELFDGELNLDELLGSGQEGMPGELGRRRCFHELFRLQRELVKPQNWAVYIGHKVVILLEGRDAVDRGGMIKCITQCLNLQVCRVAALPTSSDREQTQWHFQRYVSHLSASGEIVLLDHSWYNRAGVERVMGFYNDEQYEKLFRSVSEFEKMLARLGTQLLKYWLSISDAGQHLRLLSRIHDPLKQWKLSPMDLESRWRQEAYTKAKEIMLERIYIPETPQRVVQANDKKRARLNCIHHLLQQMPYRKVSQPPVHLPKRLRHTDYVRHPTLDEIIVPEVY